MRFMEIDSHFRYLFLPSQVVFLMPSSPSSLSICFLVAALVTRHRNTDTTKRFPIQGLSLLRASAGCLLILEDLAILAMKHDKDSVKLDLEHEHHEHFFIHKTDIMHLISGDEWLGLSHLSIWCTYLHRLCITKGTGHLYEFMDPFFIASSNASENVQTYIQKKLLEEKTKDCYLLPYLSNKHWQLLIICPKSNLVVWMCSLYYKPSSSIMRIVNSAMEGYSFMRGFRQKRQPEWVTPIVPCQNDGYSCGYYVMQNMFNIISADIISSWEETFTDRKPFKKAVLVNLQEIWAQFFMTIYAEQHRKQSKPTKTNRARTQKK